ncbi:Phage transcriptional regulator [Ferriphaselus amnicola]|uniref:Phage transcriptional regulator n=1 Tax=Ferriphaselus amnicola TaxID=1188319 RepID=A0A2Z6GEM5_9PROT|nr:AlpA family phage regulatory protein [Ferriphaselus amnicola]BBE51744.1 Phage transcriptional regulator [Ferriphaselus amnicola]
MDMRLLRLSEVLALVRLGKTTLYQLVKDGDFPAPIKISRRATAWRSEDVSNWVKTREATR